MKTALKTLVVTAVLFGFGGLGMEERWLAISVAQTTDPPPDCTNGDCPPPPPDCTNGDCPPPPPDCTNGDCPPPPPDCTNGDCPPPDPTTACCCAGENQPGDIRVCCCSSSTFETVSCRQSLVLDYGYPDNWHQTLAEVTLDGKRPRSCEILLEKFCSQTPEEVCAAQKGKGCVKMVQAICGALDKVCVYRFCGPDWFPYDEPAPDVESCEWWNRIYPCRFR